MPRLFGCKYNAEVSYIGSIQKSTRDCIFQTIYSYDDPAEALEQVRWNLALHCYCYKK